ANEYLFHFQNHKEKTIRDRAKAIHRQVAEARRIVSDAGRWQKYDQAIIDNLRTLCRANPDFTGPHSKLDNLRRWLALGHQVDPERAEDLVVVLTSEKSPSIKPLSEAVPVSAAA